MSGDPGHEDGSRLAGEPGPRAPLTREPPRFEGGVFSEQVEGGRSGASLAVTSSAVVATTPDGRTFAVPYQGVNLSLGGANGKIWFCRSADGAVTVFSQASGFVEALRASSQRELVDHLDEIEKLARATAKSYVWVLSGVLVALLFVAALGSYLVRHLGPLALRSVPTSFDQKLGKLALANMELGGDVVSDKVLNDAVKDVLERLTKAQRTTFRFQPRVVQSSMVNAFALPGGPIIVHTGLLRAAATPDELAGVLAHEMAHVERRHGMQRIAQSVGVIAVIQLMFGDVSGVMAVAVELIRAGAINGYSRGHEHEADMDAVDRMRAARLEGSALAAFFQRLANKAEADGLPELPAWLGTHPDLKRRIRDVRNRVEQRGDIDTQPFTIDWDLVRRHAGRDPDQPE